MSALNLILALSPSHSVLGIDFSSHLCYFICDIGVFHLRISKKSRWGKFSASSLWGKLGNWSATHSFCNLPISCTCRFWTGITTLSGWEVPFRRLSPSLQHCSRWSQENSWKQAHFVLKNYRDLGMARTGSQLTDRYYLLVGEESCAPCQTPWLATQETLGEEWHL